MTKIAALPHLRMGPLFTIFALVLVLMPTPSVSQEPCYSDQGKNITDCERWSRSYICILVRWFGYCIAFMYIQTAYSCLSVKSCIWCKDKETEDTFAGLAIGCVQDSYECQDVHEATLEQDNTTAESLGEVNIRSGYFYFFNSSYLNLITHYTLLIVGIWLWTSQPNSKAV